MALQAASDTHESDRAAIARTVATLVDAWNLHEAHAFAATFTDDADFTNVAGTHARGRTDIEAFHAPHFAGIFSESRLSAAVRSIRFLRPDLVAVDVDCEMTGAKFPDGSPRPYRKTLINCIMASQDNGSWLILVLHNTELPVAAPAK